MYQKKYCVLIESTHQMNQKTRRKISELSYIIKKFKQRLSINKILSYKSFSKKVSLKNIFYQIKPT